MKSEVLYYDSVVNVVFDNYGNEYEVKEGKGNWIYINKDNKKISVSSLATKHLIRNFDDVMAHYILDWHTEYPCFAIGYYVYIKESNKKVSLQDFKKIHNSTIKQFNLCKQTKI
jgi:hypothetical protein